MTAARRLAAILAADVVGHSRVTSGDGAGGLASGAWANAAQRNDAFPPPSATLWPLSAMAASRRLRPSAVRQKRPFADDMATGRIQPRD